MNLPLRQPITEAQQKAQSITIGQNGLVQPALDGDGWELYMDGKYISTWGKKGEAIEDYNDRSGGQDMCVGCGS